MQLEILGSRMCSLRSSAPDDECIVFAAGKSKEWS